MVTEPSNPGLQTDLPPVIIGTGAWGDKLLWGYGSSFQRSDLEAIYAHCLERGLNTFDTSETFGQGMAETLLGNFSESSMTQPRIISKFMPFFWRLGQRSLHGALRASLKRLEAERLFLYELHLHLPPRSIETWMDAFAVAQEEGLIEQIGVCGLSLDKLQHAIAALGATGKRLYSCQLDINLLNLNAPLANIVNYCQKQGIQVIASMPLAQGLLSGKYNQDSMPAGVRTESLTKEKLVVLNRILPAMRTIVLNRPGATYSQVALNWLRGKGIFPIVGAKTLDQLRDNLACLDWEMSPAEVAYLDERAMQD